MVELLLMAVAAAPFPLDTLDVERLILHLDESDGTYEEVVDRLEVLRRHPIDLNAAEVDDFLELPFLSAAEAHALVVHRRRHGPYPSADSLRGVAGLDAATLERLLPFVTVRRVPARRRPGPLQAEVIQRWSRKLELGAGFQADSSGYVGDPNVLQMRISARLGRRISARATFDKDAGEPLQWNPGDRRLGYDFMAGHLALDDVGWLRRLVVGDFSPRFAYGVLLRAPGTRRSMLGRGGSATIRPYASAAENGHLRGIGVEVAPRKWLSTIFFASRRRLDAAVDTTDGNPVVSRRATGLHRTGTELAGRGALREAALGGTVQSTFGPVSIAAAYFTSSEEVNASAYGFPEPLRRTVSTFSFSAGVVLGRSYLGAEVSPATGLSATFDVRSGRYGQLGIGVRRSHGAGYYPTSGFAGGSDGLTDPVTDVRLRGRHQASQAVELEYAFEHGLKRARSQRHAFASIRSSADVLLRYRPKAWLALTARATERRGEEPHVCVGGTVRCLAPAWRQAFRGQIDYRHSRHVEVRVRGEYVRSLARRFDPKGTDDRSHGGTGFLLYEELRIRIADAVQISGRLGSFSVDQSTARIYTYENDVTYAFTSPSFSGRGRRAYVFVRLKTSKSITLEGKWGVTVYEDIRAIGSGPDKIEGRRQREIRIQIRVRLS